MSYAVNAPLLVELFTEELPPKVLRRLGESFAQRIEAELRQLGLVAGDAPATPYATPRRLGAYLPSVLAQAPDREFSEKLMPVKIGLDADGAATPALLKKLAGKGLEHLSVQELARESDGKQEYLVANGKAAGALLAEGLQQALDAAIANLPIPKVMRYQLADGITSVKFVRPAHGLVALHGSHIVPVEALGLQAGRQLHGHRFLAPQPFDIQQADDYVALMAEAGKVLVSFDERRALIDGQLREHAARLNAVLGDEDPEVAALLDEVTALVEYPVVYVGEFEERFLAVPQECLILTMRLNQKYFPLFQPGSGKLTHRFLIVSNMLTQDPKHIVEGNQRVVRPRLADAEFFFNTDRKTPLAARVPQLDSIIYHNKLGTQLERVERVRQLARWLAETLGAPVTDADRAALLAKADLTTNMVGEFPELQGIMGAYYASGDGEPASVARALREQYRIRLDQPVDAASITAAILFIADRVETLVGIWGIGLAPTGERDPFGLRRAAQGLISAFEQLTTGGWLSVRKHSALTLGALLRQSLETFPAERIPASVLPEIETFVYERLRNQLNLEHERSVVDAVLATHPPLHQVGTRVEAVAQFTSLPEAASLAAANKRIGNLLKKAERTDTELNPALFTEAAEQALAAKIAEISGPVASQFEAGDFAAALSTLAQARTAVDTFFNDIMVMADDPAVRANRLALLARLHGLMNQVADLSRLAQ